MARKHFKRSRYNSKSFRRTVRRKKHYLGTRSSTISIASKFPLIRATALKFKMTIDSDNWSVYWTDVNVSTDWCRELRAHQRVNRFPGVSALYRKDLLAQNLNRLQTAFPERYKIFPKTWCLPRDYELVTSYALSHPKAIFIVKPSCGSEGRGIYITKNLKHIKAHDKMICQRYVRPFLIDGYKFDLRIYALVSSINPLRIYVYNEGLSRFTTKKYEAPSPSNMNDKFMHLTNFNLNRRSSYYDKDEIAGTKRSVTTLNSWFRKKGFDVKSLWASIDDAIIKTIIAALPTLKHYYSHCFPNHILSDACFQLLGFDMMLNHRLRPFVLEVNHSPSLSTPTRLDAEVKGALLCDTFRLLNLKRDSQKIVSALQEKMLKLNNRMCSVGTEPNVDPSTVLATCIKEGTKSATKWEKTHMGNYRRIYPNSKKRQYRTFLDYVDRLKWPTLYKVNDESNLPIVLDGDISFQQNNGRRPACSLVKLTCLDIAGEVSTDEIPKISSEKSDHLLSAADVTSSDEYSTDIVLTSLCDDLTSSI